MCVPLFRLRGIVEGFYGPYYTAAERDDLIRFAAVLGFNAYLYAPKNDRQHRSRWWEPYSPGRIAAFARTICLAQEQGVSFWYGLALDARTRYAAPETWTALASKVQTFLALGVRSFALLFDDTGCVLDEPANRLAFQSCAHSHAAIAGRLHEWLRSIDPACSLTVCPRDYHGVAPFSPYLRTLGHLLHPDIGLFYTGPEICSRRISRLHARRFAQVTGRRPLLWDNYPVNDLAMRAELHLGPLTGRDPFLYEEVEGVMVNPMNLPVASRIALVTIADYLRDPHRYVPSRSWKHAVHLVGGTAAASLALFAGNFLGSCLRKTDQTPLAGLVASAIPALRSGENAANSRPVVRLLAYLEHLDAACYTLKTGVENDALRHDVLPWIEATDAWIGTARLALNVLRGGEEQGSSIPGVRDRITAALDDARWSPLRTLETALMPLIELALERCATCASGDGAALSIA